MRRATTNQVRRESCLRQHEMGFGVDRIRLHDTVAVHGRSAGREKREVLRKVASNPEQHPVRLDPVDRPRIQVREQHHLEADKNSESPARP